MPSRHLAACVVLTIGATAGLAGCSGKSRPSLESILTGSWHCVDQNPASDGSSTPFDAQLSLGLGSWSLKEATTPTIRGSWAFANGRLRVLVTQDSPDSGDPIVAVGTQYDVTGLPATAANPLSATGGVVSSVVGSTDQPTTTSVRVDYTGSNVIVALKNSDGVDENIACSQG